MAMATKFLASILFSCVLIICISRSSAQTTCKSFRFSANQEFQTCTDLPVLSSFLHWTYYPITMTAHIAFRKKATSTTSWVAWALNPSGPTMLGSQALIAFHNSNGIPTTYATQIDGYNPRMQNGSLSFRVSNISVEYLDTEMIIFAILHLDKSLIKTNQVWQEGPMSGTSFSMHPMPGPGTQRSVGIIDFSSGVTKPPPPPPLPNSPLVPRSNVNIKQKYAHGILNVVGWGVITPIAIIMGGFMKAVNVKSLPWHFVIGCWQISGYIIGAIGWGIGMKLGGESHGITHGTHRILGILLFSFGTLHMIDCRPAGCVLVVLSIINIYQGLDILQPDPKWKTIYTGVALFLGSVYGILGMVLLIKRVCKKINELY